MNKSEYLFSYLTVLGERYTELGALMRDRNLRRRADGQPARSAGEWRCARDCRALQAIAWSIDPDDNDQSYIIQRVQLSKNGFSAILLDTSQYKIRRKWVKLAFKKLAGQVGGIMDNQRSVVHKWLQSGHGKTVIMGHHDYRIGKDTGRTNRAKREFRHRLADLVARSGVPMYFSAHTHNGAYRVQPDGNFVEFNIGSILEWPPEVHVISFDEQGDDTIFSSERYRYDSRWSEEEQHCPAHWQATAKDKDYYTGYQAYTRKKKFNHKEIKRAVYEIMLAAYGRMLRCVATAAESGAPPSSDRSDRSPVPGCLDVTVMQPGSPVRVAYDRIEHAIRSESIQPKQDLLARLARDERAIDAADATEPTEPTLLGVPLNGPRYEQYRQCQVYWAAYDDGDTKQWKARMTTRMKRLKN